jgi:hypothetical protein
MVTEWRWIGKDLAGSSRGLILRYYPGIHLEGLRKTTKNLNQGGRSPGTRITLGTSRTHSCVKHSTTTFSNDTIQQCKIMLHGTSVTTSTSSWMVLIKFTLSPVHLKLSKIYHTICNQLQNWICKIMWTNMRYVPSLTFPISFTPHLFKNAVPTAKVIIKAVQEGYSQHVH